MIDGVGGVAVAAAAIIGAVCALPAGLVYRCVARAERGEPPKPADAIIVFGAAVSAEGPSLSVRVRVDRAATLFHEGWAPRVVCTGGVDDGRSEAAAMVAMLRERGVPADALTADDGGPSTRAAIRSMRRLGHGRWRHVLAVSSPYHLHRIDAEARRQGLVVTPIAARRAGGATRAQRAYDRRMRIRETLASLGYAALAAFDRVSATPVVRPVRRVLRHLAARIAFLVRDADAVARASAAIERLIKSDGAGFRDTGTVSTPASGLLLPLEGRLVSRFGMRHRRLHAGVDIGAAYGTPVRASASGRVLHAGWLGPYGNVVVLHHGGGLATVYAHLAAIVVEVDAEIARAQVVGQVGETGRSSGPHLHFEVRVHASPVDPEVFLGVSSTPKR